MKKIAGIILTVVLISLNSFEAFASDNTILENSIQSMSFESADSKTNLSISTQSDLVTEFVTVYDYKYDKGSLKYGAWRNGVSGGSNISSSTLSFDYSYDSRYNTLFTATVTGSYTNAITIGSTLGVTLGESRGWTLGTGYSVTVPKGKRYLIKYRPTYYTYTVTETKYMERYNIAVGGMERYVVGTKTCHVNVFSHWDFTHVLAN